MQVRFLADVDLNRWIVTGLKRIEPDIDFETSITAALDSLPDSEVLRIAAERGRILVSHDRRTMPNTFYDFLTEHHSPGLILLKQSCPVGKAIDELRICYRVLNAPEFANTIHYLPL